MLYFTVFHSIFFPPSEFSALSDANLFLHHVKPAFKARCWGCHGAGDKLSSNLDIRSRDGLLRGGDGGPVVVAGNPEDSRLVQAVAGMHSDLIMPPPPDNEPLEPQQTAAISEWVRRGAPWFEDWEIEHWSYEMPERPRLPGVRNEYWPRNAIDRFILARLEEEGMQPSPEAERTTLLRRVSLDLTGLPPALEEADAFLNDASPDAYEKAVDRLLASPRFGERWAQRWLDLARYSDSNGYQHDRKRDIWLWRDWVIKAYNRDMPFDQFTIEQLAGDLLPEPTIDQRIATGFHRNTMMNEEGGVDGEEYRVVDVVDRTNTTATVWLGTTLACAQCHDHKYDPISQEDYFSFYAFFNSTADSGIYEYRHYEFLELPTPEEQKLLDDYSTKVQSLKAQVEAAIPALKAAQSDWEQQFYAGALPDSAVPPGIRTILEKPAKRTQQEAKQVFDFYRTVDPMHGATVKKYLKLRADRSRPPVTRTLVMKELPEPRPTAVHIRGNFLNPGRPVSPRVPRVWPSLPEGEPRNRLTLARWLVSRDNPLTARVTVNRFWEALFGRGLVSTVEDFGIRGEPPSHPELLDWLAVEFVEQGWSVKKLLKFMVMSAAYRQSSRLSPELLERDPYNMLLARGPRFRMEAEMLRDNALAIAGLLSDKMFGPSVFPHQPEGIWNTTYALDDHWKLSAGIHRFRRGVYTYIKRTALYPSYMIFDMKPRESCTASRSRTNTPMQALAAMNDPVFIQSAAGLALRMMTEVMPAAEDVVQARLRHGFRLAMTREPRTGELLPLHTLLETALQRYRNDPKAARAMTDELPDELKSQIAVLQPDELAAWTVVANVLLNLDAVLTKS